MDRWNGKIAVITGANQGIGFAILKTLNKNGIVVVGLDINVENIKVLSDESPNIHALECNITKENEIINAFKWIEEVLGGVDILINNAGVCPISTISDGDTAKWKLALDVNLLGTSMCTREALKTMKKRGDDGQIINMNSIKGHETLMESFYMMYSASKHGVTVLTKYLRKELFESKSKIKVTSLSLGGVHTSMSNQVCKEVYKVEGPALDAPTPRSLLSIENVVDTVISILSLHPNIQVDELTMHKVGAEF